LPRLPARLAALLRDRTHASPSPGRDAHLDIDVDLAGGVLIWRRAECPTRSCVCAPWARDRPGAATGPRTDSRAIPGRGARPCAHPPRLSGGRPDRRCCQHATSTTMTQSMPKASPTRPYRVRSRRAAMVALTLARTSGGVAATVRPHGSITADGPAVDVRTSHPRRSTARVPPLSSSCMAYCALDTPLSL